MDKNSTAAPERQGKHSDCTPLYFPIPHVNQEPIDDIIHATCLLNVMCKAFDTAIATGMDKASVSDLYSVLSEVQSTLRPLQRFLDNLDYPALLEDYQAARRAEIVKSCAGVTL